MSLELEPEVERYPLPNPDSITARLDRIEKALKLQNIRFSWEDRQADGGIILAGSTTITKTGVLLAAVPIPTGPNQITVALVMSGDDGELALIAMENAKRVES